MAANELTSLTTGQDVRRFDIFGDNVNGCLVKFVYRPADDAKPVPLSSIYQYFQLEKPHYGKMLLAVLVAGLQMAAFIIIIARYHQTHQVDGHLRLEVFLCFYPIICLVLCKAIYNDATDTLKVALHLLSNASGEYGLRSHNCNFWDVFAVVLESAVIILMALATIFVVNRLDNVLDILFNFAGLLVILNLDNCIVAPDVERFSVTTFNQDGWERLKHDERWRKGIAEFIVFVVLYVSMVVTGKH